MADEQGLIEAFERCYGVQQEQAKQWVTLMKDEHNLMGFWLKKRLLRKHPEAWAAECEHTLWALGNCIGDKDAQQIAEFFGCQESDVVEMLATISLCREQSEFANIL